MQPLAQRHAQKILSHSQIVTYSSRQLVSHIKEYAPKAKIIRIPYCVNDVKFRMYGISEQACWEMKERLRLKPDDTGVILQVNFTKIIMWTNCFITGKNV